MKSPNIVILGAGYGGIMTAVKLQKKLGANDAKITLVNKHDYHYQTTWLHENAAGTLHHDRTRIKIKDVVNTSRVDFVQDTVTEIKQDEKKVLLENSELNYDYLVIGLGFEAATFGIPGLQENAYMINNINSSRLIRQHIEYNFAKYNNEAEPNEERLNIVVGGAGFTGIEFVGELANRVPELCKEYDIPREKVRIINVEAAPTALPGFDPALVEYAMNSLEARGVEFKIGAMIKEVTENKLVFEKDEEREEIATNTVVWAAGVRGNSLVENAGFESNRGRTPVDGQLRPKGYDDVFIVGDCSLIMNEESGRPYPPTAQIAIQQAEHLAGFLTSQIRGGGHEEDFVPNIQGTVASLGDDDAIGVIFDGKKLFGWQASAMKKIIDNRYLLKLGGLPLVLKKGKLNFFNF
ncbi:NAD(P)/FAD-dependent oxidoreductase [Halobacillus litoralis]|uniref:NAD(P)/FAD-dependent oxidoreductase n=1 Tax=Halobacillus litoralis TaxID=45668 RepID=UPI001CD2AEC1|nr:NAD(P)/FAD-dependent oxidoreductase [Halobacillus litoralis]MCA0971782.1 NAD(P)/FAD-dependent oxidoreductase [Halobacillus litoralis]